MCFTVLLCSMYVYIYIRSTYVDLICRYTCDQRYRCFDTGKISRYAACEKSRQVHLRRWITHAYRV